MAIDKVLPKIGLKINISALSSKTDLCKKKCLKKKKKQYQSNPLSSRFSSVSSLVSFISKCINILIAS